ncbi:MAG: hypothetical protein EPN23_07410 [Verrucomicrobia bacterium]|nr:MAG: hypothetical protein EPN23_07410 [Verrucomicrobiota bacterium]
MKISRKVTLALATLTLATTLSASAFTLGPVRQEASVGALTFLPKDNNSLYNNGWGGEAQYRFWLTDDWALALAAGAARMNVAADAKEITEFGGTAGTVDILPLGADLIYNVLDIAPVRLNAQAGVRYIIASSDASSLNVAGKRVDMTVDNGTVWRVGLDADFALTQKLAIFAAGSYQQDFGKQGISTVDGPLRDNTFRGFLLEAGLRARF